MANQNQETINSYLSFQVGNEVFAANVAHIINILEITKITRVPKAPKFMKGVMNLRGSVLPVLDTRIKFGLEETAYTTNTCILVIELRSKNERIQLGAIVDSVKEVLELDGSDIQPPPSIGTTFDTKLLNGMTMKNDEFIMIINVDKVFSDDEIINIKETKVDAASQTS